MSQIPTTPWIHIGECPVCVDGLCRVRACQDEQGHLHLFAMCDECEATWTRPDTSSQKTYPRRENPTCPICSRPLYGDQSHWAEPEEVSAEPDWSIAAIFEMPYAMDQPPVRELLVVDDIATDLDAPDAHRESSTLDAQTTNDSVGNSFADNSYGMDEPKPGC